MSLLPEKERDLLEVALIILCIGLACLLHVMQGYKMVILNLYFLPVTMGAFFLGRYRAGILALFSAIGASTVIVFGLHAVTAESSPLVIVLAVTVWAAVLGLTAMLVGTLSDDRSTKTKELHEAYVGVIEVLSQYLQSAHPRLKARSVRVAELSQRVALAMKLSPRQIDDIRVAALLYDMGHIEVTTKVIRRAVGTFDVDMIPNEKHTFQGADLMLSLGNVLTGAIPLLLNQDREESGPRHADPQGEAPGVPIGARIIRAARAYLELAAGHPGQVPGEIVAILRQDSAAAHDPSVLHVLERTVTPLPAERDVEVAEPAAAV
jgi:HD-GYP domain-containing protein (c-di-GMP phosphodiesterase class II)